MVKYSIILGILLGILGHTSAQVACPKLVDSVLSVAGENCRAMQRNQACYGNASINASFVGESTVVQFSQVGDIVSLTDLESLTLAPLDETNNIWGIALLSVQANLPDTVPGQAVRMVIFGDTTVTNTGSSDKVAFVGTLATTGNVRMLPSTEGVVIDSLPAGSGVTILGRSDDDMWVYSRLSGNRVGWIFAELLTIEGDMQQLPVVDAKNPQLPEYGVMQSFVLKNGVGDPSCDGLPIGGILIQTPQGTQTITLEVNGATLTLGSTAVLQTDNRQLTVALIEGYAILSTAEGSTTIPAGTVATLTLDDAGMVTGAPSEAQPYNVEDYSSLPLALLDSSVTVAPALSLSEIPEAVNALQIMSINGVYDVTQTITTLGGSICGSIQPQTLRYNISLSDDGTLTWESVDLPISPYVFEGTGDLVNFLLPPIPSSTTTEVIGNLTYTLTSEGYGTTLVFTSPTSFTAYGEGYVQQTQDGRVIYDCRSGVSYDGIKVSP